MLGARLENVRKTHPLIHNITNYVTVNDVANIILSCGGRPVMSDEPDEAEDIVSSCQGLNINIGTLNTQTVRAMHIAGKKANSLGIPVLLDPVGVNASRLRYNTVNSFLKELELTAICGNITEIKAISDISHKAGGVDAAESDMVTKKNIDTAVSLIRELSAKYHCIIAVTGEIDLVSDSKTTYVIHNGCAEMGSITGTGCQLSGLMTAFIAANPDNVLEACAAAVCTMGLAGENAYGQLSECGGNAELKNRIIDEVYNMTSNELDRGAKYEIR